MMYYEYISAAAQIIIIKYITNYKLIEKVLYLLIFFVLNIFMFLIYVKLKSLCPSLFL